MKISTTVQNKYRLISIICILVLWQSMSYIYSPIIVPSISEVLRALADIFTTKEMEVL